MPRTRTRLLGLALAAPALLLAVIGCGNSSSDATTDTTASGPTAATQDASGGAANYFDNDPTGENVLAILTTGYPDAIVGCTGKTGYNPIAITNTTDSPQVAWLNLSGSNIDAQVSVMPQSQVLGIQGCPQSVGGGATDGWVTVQPGQTWVGGVAMGGSIGPHTNVNQGKNYLEVGGTPSSGSAAPQWYDMQPTVGDNGGYKGWFVKYSYTGGTDPSQNEQAGLLNVVQCSGSNQGGNLQLTIQSDQIMTPYAPQQASAWQPSAPENGAYLWSNGMPVCFAFLPSS